MGTAVKISTDLFEKAKLHSIVYQRSVTGQIEYWAGIGQTAEDNPELPLTMIQAIQVSKAQIQAGQGSPYQFGEGEAE